MTNRDEAAWEAGWRDHEIRQLRRLAGLTLAQKLEWLEQAHALVQHLASSRRHDEGGTNSRQRAVNRSRNTDL